MNLQKSYPNVEPSSSLCDHIKWFIVVPCQVGHIRALHQIQDMFLRIVGVMNGLHYEERASDMGLVLLEARRRIQDVMFP
ncbi:hypothetical protein J6590_000712 [Homalodisca vitripennis]|nr:hypothetical protein J6590_000712 [Homalodisca vitripennis]